MSDKPRFHVGDIVADKTQPMHALCIHQITTPASSPRIYHCLDKRGNHVSCYYMEDDLIPYRDQNDRDHHGRRASEQ